MGLFLPPGNTAIFTVDPNFARCNEDKTHPHHTLRNLDIRLKNILLVSLLRNHPPSTCFSYGLVPTASGREEKVR